MPVCEIRQRLVHQIDARDIAGFLYFPNSFCLFKNCNQSQRRLGSYPTFARSDLPNWNARLLFFVGLFYFPRIISECHFFSFVFSSPIRSRSNLDPFENGHSGPRPDMAGCARNGGRPVYYFKAFPFPPLLQFL